MHCEICDQVNVQYANAVENLHQANQHLRQTKFGTLDSALSRRKVHDALHALIAAEAEKTAHRSWHIECLTALPGSHSATI